MPHINEKRDYQPTFRSIKAALKAACPRSLSQVIKMYNDLSEREPMSQPTSRQSVNTSNVLSIIMGGGQGKRLFPLTKERAKPAVPLSGEHRLVEKHSCKFTKVRRLAHQLPPLVDCPSVAP